MRWSLKEDFEQSKLINLTDDYFMFQRNIFVSFAEHRAIP